MRNIAVSDDVFGAITRIATAHQQSPQAVLTALFTPRLVPVTRTELVINLLLNSDFQEQLSDEKYLAVLTWLASRHSGDFSDFILRDPSNERYIALAQQEIRRLRRRRITRPIQGTRFWAVMNIGADAKRQFLGRLLDFVGYDTPVVDIVCLAVGLPRSRPRRSFLI